MEIEESQQIFFPRVLSKHLKEYDGKRVTLIGQVVNDQKKGFTVINIGNDYLVGIENLKKTEIAQNTAYIEVRGTVIGQNSIKFDEYTELPQGKDQFDYETYGKLVELTLSDKFKHIFQENC